MTDAPATQAVPETFSYKVIFTGKRIELYADVGIAGLHELIRVIDVLKPLMVPQPPSEER